MFTLLEICEYRYEAAAYSYFKWIFNRWTIQFYRLRNGLFQFRIDLPFFLINNDWEKKFVPIADNTLGVNPGYRTVAVINGKILLWKIKI